MRSSIALRSYRSQVPREKSATLQKQGQVGHFVKGRERDQLGPQQQEQMTSVRRFLLHPAVHIVVLLLVKKLLADHDKWRRGAGCPLPPAEHELSSRNYPFPLPPSFDAFILTS